MTKTYETPSGKILTEDMIQRWTSAYEQGEFPAEEHSTGKIVHGRPPLSTQGSAVISVKVPLGMKKAIEQEARAAGVSTSVYAREALVDKLLA